MSDLAFGLQITVWGMGLVFALLGLLWALLAIAGRLETRAAARAAPRHEPPPAAATEPPPAPEPARLIAAGGTALRVSGPGAAELSPEATAAIAAAVIAHVANRRGQAAPEMRSYWPGSLLFASRWVVAGRTRQTRGYRRERS
jgi:Na+-transporting methylmalonyl-CoA/oxaloacetate decarboxylase gamma subunit